ncbi:MAG: thioredoxin domain-containing protein [Gemmataceae bacterium]
MSAFTNRLIRETSPYLKQHAHNPVDWHPWGPEALERAKELDRPIFLSIGYSACHWCHVMERESFEDPAIGKLLNDSFVSIKVDREERPDLDQIYMASVQLLTQQGGWPMSVFLTPDLKPFYGGTYFPPRDLYGRPSFRRVLEALATAWKDQRDHLLNTAKELSGHVQEVFNLKPKPGDLTPALLENAYRQLGRRFDAKYGGFGGAPKFPHPIDLRLLLRLHQRLKADDALAMVRKSLDGMARGGMCDQIGGGFHRYSTDARWLVPHFEKMLYDNALLAVVYVEAWQITGDAFYRQIAEETLDYVRREMTRDDGPFFSTQDADSEGEEGKFFVWTPAELKTILGIDDAAFAASVWDVTADGNWEGVNVLHRSRSDVDDAQRLNLPLDTFQIRLRDAKTKMVAARSKRVWPGRDEKILTAWNGLMISAFALGGLVFDRRDYVEVACKAADFVLTRMRAADGKLLRTSFQSSEAKLNGYLEDYAYLLDALVSVYEATFDPRWIESALDVARVMIDEFWDDQDGGFYYTGKSHETLIARTKDPHDNATPSANSVATMALLRLATLTDRADLREKAEKTLNLFRGLLESSPAATAQMCIALDFYLGPVEEFVLVGDLDYGETQKTRRLLAQTFRPRRVLAGKSDHPTRNGAEKLLPLLANRSAQGIATVYWCEHGVCKAPIIGSRSLEQVFANEVKVARSTFGSDVSNDPT